MILRVYCKNVIKEVEMLEQKQITIGNHATDTINFSSNFLKKGHIKIVNKNNKWMFSSSTALVSNNNAITVGEIVLGRSFIIDAQNKIAMMCYERNHNGSCVVELALGYKALIGRSSDCSIQINDKAVSAKHLEIVKSSNGYVIKNLSKSGGTYLNGVLVDEAYAKSGDVLDLGFSRIVLSQKAFSIISSYGISNNIVNVVEPQIKSTENAADEYPHLFKQSPRMIETVKQNVIEFQSAPSIGGKPKINWVSVLVPSLSSVTIMLTVALLLGGPLIMLFFSVPMAIVGIVMSVYNYKNQCKEYKNNENLRLEKYSQYLNEQEQQIKDYHYEQFKIMTEIHPNTSDCISIVSQPARRLWERRTYDSDFMQLRIGIGNVDSLVEYRVPKKQLSLQEDALDDEAKLLTEKYKKVDNCPILYDARLFKTCGIIGPRAQAVKLAKNMILQACTHHSYENLKIVTIFDSEETSQWKFVKWLAHSYDNMRIQRYIVNNPFSARKVLSEVEEEILVQASGAGGGSNEATFYLFIIAERALIQNHSLFNLLVDKDSTLPIASVLLFNQLHNLPKDCQMVIELENENGKIYNSFDSKIKTDFTPDNVDENKYEVYSRTMAPIRVAPKQGKGTLPTVITFLQAYKVNRAKELVLQNRWGKMHPEKSMAVPIGVRINKEPFMFDIHEKQHGPHGLVAGTTGSGKSEMVQSWILSMALHFSPLEVSFVLIDFKGTGLILPFKNLPHIAGTISDLDVSITRNLLALENELNRRKMLFDKYGVSNISSYLKLYRQGKVNEPLSYMFIVIDEFAEFKIQFPEFMSVVNSVFATGRTLGVHIVLLTQKPTNVVDDKMHANTRFRWCLKVASSADSKDMLHHPDAAMIKNPGRAFVQVGEDEIFEEIQTYWSGAPYVPFNNSSVQYNDKIYIVDLYGNKNVLEAEKTTGYRSEENEIDAIVNYIDNYTRTNELERARNVWTSKLPIDIELSDIIQIAFDGENWNDNEGRFCPVVGMIDNPKMQSQYPMKLDFLNSGHVAVYGAPSTGKTTFIHTVIMSSVLTYKPDELNIYAFDFGGGSLNLFKDFPHVGCVARDTQTETVEKLINLLSDELASRKDKIANSGLINIETYRDVTGENFPYILIVVDNFAPVFNLYPNSDQFFQTMSSQGGAYGMFLLITGGVQNAISYRVAQNIKSAVALQMTDKNDYAAIVGRTNGLEPENYPGRGLFKAKEPLEFQTALPASKNDSARASAIISMSKLMKEKWRGKCAPNIPVMPQVVDSNDYNGINVFIGLDTERIQPIYFENEMYLLLVSTINKNQGIAFFNQLAFQFINRQKNAKAIYVGNKYNLNVTDNLTIIDNGAQFDDYLENLIPELKYRLDSFQSGTLTEFEPLLIAISDYEWCFENINNMSHQRLASITQLGQGIGIYLFLFDTATDVTNKYHSGDNCIINCISKSMKILLGANVRAHDVLANDVSVGQKEMQLSDKLAFVTHNGQGNMVRIAEK